MENERIDMKQDESIITFDNLLEAASTGDWEKVDNNISNFASQPSAIDWSLQTGINSEDGNIRDFAVTLLEHSDAQFSEETQNVLQNLMQTDDNPYVQFRSAFALFSHGDRSKQVMAKIKSALEDEDVKDIATKYLQLENEK